jgi:hypothetical protein
VRRQFFSLEHDQVTHHYLEVRRNAETLKPRKAEIASAKVAAFLILNIIALES